MKKKTIYKLIFITLPFVLAFPFHFIYEFIPFPLFSIYFPVNESVFEHIKLTFTPLILTYLFFYLLKRKNIDLKRYFSSLIISISIAFVTMLTIFYGYKIFTDKDITIINILSLFIGLSLGQIISIYSYKKGIRWSIDVSVFSLITITLIFLIFTVNPPKLDFFFDKNSFSYGIKK